jgi:hypothetical protein
MVDMERGRIGGEQLLVLWTWLLQGYVPVAHIVADTEVLDVLAPSADVAPTSTSARRARKEAAA